MVMMKSLFEWKEDKENKKLTLKNIFDKNDFVPEIELKESNLKEIEEIIDGNLNKIVLSKQELEDRIIEYGWRMDNKTKEVIIYFVRVVDKKTKEIKSYIPKFLWLKFLLLSFVLNCNIEYDIILMKRRMKIKLKGERGWLSI